MEKAQIMTPSEAAALVKDGSTIITATVASCGHAESVMREMEKNFFETGHPRDLTVAHSAGSSDNKGHGSMRYCHEGMIKRYIAAHWGSTKEWIELIGSNKVECFNFSQGTIVHLFRAMANGQPGHITKTGLYTYIDPRQEGGRMNDRTKECGDEMVQLIDINGEEYLFYKTFPVDFVMIRGTYADEYGNIVMDDEAVRLEVMAVVLAGKRYGAKVIAQVKRIAKEGSLNAMDVVVPGCFVDILVECDNIYEEHKMTTLNYYEPAYIGKIKLMDDKLPGIPIPMDIRKIIGRRAAMECHKGVICNVGIGIPYDTVSRILYEEGIKRDVLFTVETGVYGGLLPPSVDFGAAYNFDAMLDQPTQFDFYNSIGVDIAFMGCGEIDEIGNGNASRMGKKVTGCGGFVDITQYAHKTVFCMPFTAGGLKVEFDEGKGLRIIEEGTYKKFVKKVNQITYNADLARREKRDMKIITERAVFSITDKSIKLIEIAKGVDINKDVLGQMEFVPEMAKEIKIIDPRIYRNGLIGFKEIIGCDK